MPRAQCVAPGGDVYHVLNRGVGRMTIFNKPEDYQAFINVLVETCVRRPGVELLAYCVMPNHWHSLVRPRRGGDLSEFMRLLTVTHTQRYHAHYRTAGTGPVSALGEKALESVRTCNKRGRPMGEAGWVERTAAKLGVGSFLRPRGRPKREG